MFEEWLNLLMSPSLDWIQVEVTSCCNAACTYCPHTVYRDAWLNRHLPLQTFERLEPLFGKAGLVFLQGWGEPLLHPELLRMISTAKSFGCKVGTTTNGTLLDVDIMHQLVESGVDVLAFSLAGVDERNDAIRRGTSVAKVVDAIRTLHQIKMDLGRKLPDIHIAYMLLRSGLSELERLPCSFQGLGATEIVISTLDFVASEELLAEAVLPATAREYDELQSRLEKVRAEAARLGLTVHWQLYRPNMHRPTCTENVGHALYVSADGTVAPCVFSNLPVSQPVRMCRNDGKCYRPVVFGNINDAPTATIWRRRTYRDFREAFGRGRLPTPCDGCPKSCMGSEQ